MTLGERIQELRRKNGLSQEMLAEKMNVSRQAVSKWETGLSNPDTDNLIRLAALFNTSVDELLGAKSETAASRPKRSLNKTVMIISSLLTIAAVTAAVWAVWYRQPVKSPDNSSSSSEDAVPEPSGEYALIFGAKNTGETQILEVGPQTGAFPWGKALSGSDSSFTSGDMPGAVFHNVDCGDIALAYSHNDDTGQETLTSMSTASPNYSTPRGIKVGDTENGLIAAYGDNLLVRPEAYSGLDEFCMYNSLYAYIEENKICNTIVFYMLDGQISGIKVSAPDDGAPAYYADNVSTFPLRNGKPDYSEKKDPDLETLSKERKVYVALHTLLNYAMTEEDAKPYRETIYNGLRNIDWIAYGKLGEAGKDTETIWELLDWLDAQESLSGSELTGLQLTLMSNIDGAYADKFSTVLYHAFLNNPTDFIECMNQSYDNGENSDKVVMMTVYGAGTELTALEGELNELIDCGALSDGAVPWAEKMLDRCADPYGEIK